MITRHPVRPEAVEELRGKVLHLNRQAIELSYESLQSAQLAQKEVENNPQGLVADGRLERGI